MDDDADKGQEVQSKPHQPGVRQPGEMPEQMTLADFLTAADPIATKWIQSQERTQERNLDFERDVLHEEGRRHRNSLVAGSALAIGVLALAGILVVLGRDDTAIRLIELLATIAGVGFGGYGVGRLARRRVDEEE